MVRNIAKIGANARSQALGLAYVENVVPVVFHKLDARFLGNFFQARLKLLRVIDETGRLGWSHGLYTIL